MLAVMPTNRSTTRTRDERRVLASTLVGTTIEWYDFFIYAQAANVVFAPLFYTPLSETSSRAAAIPHSWCTWPRNAGSGGSSAARRR